MNAAGAIPLLDDELTAFSDSVAAFAADHLPAPAAQAEETDRLPPSLVDALVGQGLWTLGLAERDGGGGAGPLPLSVAVHRVAAVAPVGAVAVALGHAASLAVADESVRTVTRVAQSGSLPVLIDTTDPLTSIRVTRSAAGWLVRGTAERVEGAGSAALFVLADPEAGALFIAPSAPGCAVGETIRRCGLRGLPPHPVSFDDVRVDSTASAAADAARARTVLLLLLGAVACGITDAAWRAARDYSVTRTQFGRPLVEFPAFARKIDAMAEEASDRALALMNAARQEEDGAGIDPAWVARRCAHAAVEVAEAAIQAHGGYGYLVEYPVERAMRDAVTVRALISAVAARQPGKDGRTARR